MKLEHKTSKHLLKYNEAGMQNKQTVIQVQWSWNAKQANSYKFKYNEVRIQNKQTVINSSTIKLQCKTIKQLFKLQVQWSWNAKQANSYKFKYNEVRIQNKQTVIQVQWSWNTKQANSYSSTMKLECKTSKQLFMYNEAGI